VIGFLIAAVLSAFLTQRYTDAEARRMRCEYLEAERARGLGEMRRKLGLPEAPTRRQGAA
jgi:hypothetical protein